MLLCALRHPTNVVDVSTFLSQNNNKLIFFLHELMSGLAVALLDWRPFFVNLVNQSTVRELEECPLSSFPGPHTGQPKQAFTISLWLDVLLDVWEASHPPNHLIPAKKLPNSILQVGCCVSSLHSIVERLLLFSIGWVSEGVSELLWTAKIWQTRLSGSCHQQCLRWIPFNHWNAARFCLSGKRPWKIQSLPLRGKPLTLKTRF